MVTARSYIESFWVMGFVVWSVKLHGGLRLVNDPAPWPVLLLEANEIERKQAGR